ncbi:tol-pal system protein YbgF [Aestuariirhabdus sp. LZHN29]|uniref:tol-pal system protein YbgF n=1 Tax=Aestuariirhabdus sp. LZHN29 TaxID=3417462 RepID=UPI003CEEBD75
MAKQRKRLLQISPAIAGLFVVGMTWAEVPVVETTPIGGAAVQPQAGTEEAVQSQQPTAENSLYYQLELLQQEVQSLRGMLEEQSHAMRLMKQEQRDRYIDLDRRISLLNSPSGSSTSAPSASASVSVPTTTVGTPGGSSTSTLASANPELEKQAYSEAFALIKERKFDQAIVALNAFVQQYPGGDYAANARYWLGEVYLATNQAEPAQGAFENVLKEFPSHRKAADASYKLGRMYHSQGDVEQARSYFQATIDNYPGSSAAKLSQQYLQKL